MNYMVMECHPAFVVVMDEEGRFFKAANRGYQVGQTIPEIIEMQLPDTSASAKKGKVIRGPWMRTIAAVAACLVLAVLVALPRGPVAYASVYLRINPEVRIDVDKNDGVVGLTAQNPDGTLLLEGYTYQEKTLEQVVSELVDRAVLMDFLQDGGRVTLSLDAEDLEWVAVHQTALQETLGAHLAAQPDTEAIRIELDVWDEDDLEEDDAGDSDKDDDADVSDDDDADEDDEDEDDEDEDDEDDQDDDSDDDNN